MSVKYGKVELDQIVLSLTDPSIKPTTVCAEVAGEIIPCVISQQDENVRIRLAGIAEIFPGDTLSLKLAW